MSAVPEAPLSPDDTYEAVLSDAAYEELDRLEKQMLVLEASVRVRSLPVIRAMAQHKDALRNDGHRGVTDWVITSLGLSPRSAKELIRVANIATDCPRLVRGYSQGEMSWDRLALVTTGLDGYRDDAWWNEHHRSYSDDQIKAIIRTNKNKPTDLSSAFESRRISLRRRDEVGIIHGEFPIDMFAVLETAIDRIAHEAKPDATGEYPTVEKARADALVEICSSKLSKDPDADRATVVIHGTVPALKGEGDHAELDDVLLTNEAFKRICCDARFQVASVDALGKTVGISRVSRNIPRWLRRLIRKRDRGCQFPGCHKKRWTDIHHIRFWSEGGETNLDNLIELCVAHHHYVHDFGWTIHGNPEVAPVRFFNPKGRELTVGGWDVDVPVEDFWLGFEETRPKHDWLLRETITSATSR